MNERVKFHAHPSIGLKPIDIGRPAVFSLSEDQMGTGWTMLRESQQNKLEETFFFKLFTVVFNGQGMDIEIEFLTADGVTAFIDKIAIESPGASFKVETGNRVIGVVTPACINAITETGPVYIKLWREGELRLTLHDDWGGVAVTLSDEEAKSLSM